MTDLAERYVRAVLAAVPASQRQELEREIRALVADAIEAKTTETGSAGAEAERAALTDLGDPALLAGRYTGRTAYLIGPSLFPEWRRILSAPPADPCSGHRRRRPDGQSARRIDGR